MLIIGGPFPTNDQVARLASCEAGRIVPVEDPVPTPCPGLLTTGQGYEFNRMAYRDPAAQAVLKGPTLAAPPAPERPYSCRLLDDAARKCAFGACDQRERDRLTKECLRDGGRP